MNGRKCGTRRALAIMMSAIVIVSSMGMTVCADEHMPDSSDAGFYEETVVTGTEASVQEDENFLGDESEGEDHDIKDQDIEEGAGETAAEGSDEKPYGGATAGEPESMPAEKPEEEPHGGASAAKSEEEPAYEPDEKGTPDEAGMQIEAPGEGTPDEAGTQIEAPGEGTPDETDALIEAPLSEEDALATDNAAALDSSVIASVSYVKRSWDGTKVVSSDETAHDIQPVPSGGSMTSGWYYLNSNVTKDDRITSITGDVNLILGDGFTLDVKGLYVPEGSTLTIYAQSDGENAGNIYSHPGKSQGGAGIGGYSGRDNGNIVIHGGNIEANGYDHCAGIGTNDGHTGGTITIYGGTITAKGGSDGAGIGGGRNCDGGEITIYGGDITSKGGGENGAGIGGGDSSDGGTIIIYSGTIKANEDPNEDGAGIGGGDAGDGGNITINGGKITCWSRDGAGIGGGDDGEGGTITINGGDITCWDSGHAQGARIGGGSDADGGTITINGGTVHVYNRDGAGIGGGEDNDGGTITITGGEVNTEYRGRGNGAGIGGGNHAGDGGTITISGGTVNVTANYGAGIGGGRAKEDDDPLFNVLSNSGDGGTITITGGKVTTTSENAYGIGAGATQFDHIESALTSTNKYDDGIGSAGTVTIKGNAEVTASGYLAGIGGDGGNITIEGGTVTVQGLEESEAGYGIQLCSKKGKVNIQGGVVYANGFGRYAGIANEFGTVSITGGTVIAHSPKGPALGGGVYDRKAGDIHIFEVMGKMIISGENTYVKATSDELVSVGGYGCDKSEFVFEPGPVIETKCGENMGEGNSGRRLSQISPVYEGASVKAGTDSEHAEMLPAGERANAHKKYDYLLVRPCEHGEYTYTISADSHAAHCEYCGKDFAETPHDFSESGTCTTCGYAYDGELITVHFDANGGSGEMADETVIPGSKLILPECGFIAPHGYVFDGWLAGDTTKLPDDEITVSEETTLKAVWKEAILIKGVTGSFNDRIKLNYYFNMPSWALPEDAGVYVTLTNEETQQKTDLMLNSAEYVEGKGYRFSILLAAKEESDTITARAFDGQGNPITIIGDTTGNDYTKTGVQCSLMKYFTWLAKEGEDDKEMALGAAAKDYCAAAQLYFGHKADGVTVSSAVDAVTAETLKGYVAGREGTLPTGVSIKGISAMLESDNTLRLYLGFKEVDLSALSFTIDGKDTVLKKRSDGMYYLALDAGVYSNHLQDTHTYSVSGGGNTYTITASALTYARCCVNKSDENEINLGKTLYLYNKAAVAAFGGE